MGAAAFLTGVVFALAPATEAQKDPKATNSQALFSRWPEMPGKFVNVDPTVASGPVGKPVFETFQNDPYLPGTIPPDFNGYLLYTPRVSLPGELPSRMYSLRRIGGEASATDPRGVVAQYPGTEGEGDVSEPLFSPNGRAMSYKSGRLGEHGFYQIYVWDFEQKRVVKVTNYGSDLTYPNYYWSPDSRRIAYVLGTDEDGEEGENGVAALGIAQVSDAKNAHLPGKPVLRMEGQPFFPSLSMFAWSSPQSVAFVQINPLDTSATGTPRKSQKGSQARSSTSIYEDSFTLSKPQKIIADGYAPAVSPDNDWIAFLRKLPPHYTLPQNQQTQDKHGSAGAMENSSSSKASPTGSEVGVFLYNREAKKEIDTEIRLDKTSKYEFDEALRWTADSRRLVVAEVYAPGPFSTHRKSIAEVRVQVVELAKLQPGIEKTVGIGPKGFEVRALPKWYVDGPSTTILVLSIKSTTENGRYLVFSQAELTSQVKNNDSLKQKFVVMDLQQGQIYPVAEFSPVWLAPPTTIGWDWISAPEPRG